MGPVSAIYCFSSTLCDMVQRTGEQSVSYVFLCGRCYLQQLYYTDTVLAFTLYFNVLNLPENLFLIPNCLPY